MRRALLLCSCFAFWLVTPGIALAHARLAKAEPASRSDSIRAPARIRLTFNESVEISYSHIQLEDSTGKVVTDGPLAAPAAKTLDLPLPTLAPGRYRVRYRVLSADGHVIENQYEFGVKAPSP